MNYEFVEPTFEARTKANQLAICQSIYDANTFNTQNWIHGFTINPDMLPNAVINFLHLLEEKKVNYAIVGGIAYLAYIHDRNTKDLDILISVKELEKIIDDVEVTNKDANFTNARFQGMAIDFLKTSNAIFDYVYQNEITTYNFEEGSFPIATITGLILMRMDAIIDLYQKGKFVKAVYYERDLFALDANYEINWDDVFKIAKQFFTEGQINEFRKIIGEFRRPRFDPFA